MGFNKKDYYDTLANLSDSDFQICFLSTSKRRVCETVKQAAKEALLGNKVGYVQMKSTAKAYTTKRKCFIEEVVSL